jgi:hypothetical protein
MTFIKLFSTVFLLICSACTISIPVDNPPFSNNRDSSHTLLFYNLENLFHPSDDSLNSDDPFTPVGERYWTYRRYKKKLSFICKVLLSAGEWEPPVFIGLCEIENEKVLKDLIFHPLMINYKYKYLHRDSPDHRGIDVALLYRPGYFSNLSHRFIASTLPGRSHGTRDILHGAFTSAEDTIDIFVNHWTSKYGGAYETEELRLYQAKLLSAVIDTLLEYNSGHKVIICGDFNDNSHSASIKQLSSQGLIEEIQPQNGRCTYKYQGRWDLIDHVFIAGSWSKNSCITEVFEAPYLLEEDGKYTGRKPFRTYLGFTYNGGVSDHLPILLHFNPEADSGD